MGSIIMHLYISKKIQQKYNFGDNFMIGSVLPDIYKKVSMSRMASHYLYKYTSPETGLLFLPDIEKYMKENKAKKNDELTIGYFSHLIEDFIWFRYYSGKFAKSIGFDENGDEIFTYAREKHKINHLIGEFKDEVYKDYMYADSLLLKKENIDLEKIKSDLKVYLNDSNFDEVVDFDLSVHSVIEGRDNLFITDKVLDDYIEESLNYFDKMYKEFEQDDDKKNYDVIIVKCKDYDEENVKNAFDELLPLIGNLSYIPDGSKVAIKANLVASMKPEKAGTTNPILLKELCKRLLAKNCEVVIGDSPAGPYSSMNLNGIYKNTGLLELVDMGVKLNDDFSIEKVKFPEGAVCREFQFTSYLKKADYIIDFCKLKSHGMMGMSCAVKNFFGVIPGTIKPEFHFRYPNYSDFANMLIDLNEYVKPCLCIVDGVIAMEGNGPTAGEPKQVGLILASKNQYKLDMICAKIIGLDSSNVPTIEESIKRDLAPRKLSDIYINTNIENILIRDFDTRKVHKSLWFDDDSKFIGRLAKKLLKSKPKLNKSLCIGCERCKDVCPAKAIYMKNGKPMVDRKKCIKCFCCQEFCPKGAMRVKRTLIAKILTRG